MEITANATKKTYPYIDFAKLIFAILVLVLHSQQYSGYYSWSDPSSNIILRLSGSFVFDVLCRLAVPFFFVATSFFLFSKIESASDSKEKKQFYVAI